MYQRVRHVAPIAVQELSLLVLWLLSTPIISNYIAVKAIFDPIWYACIAVGHLARWYVLYYRYKSPPRLRWVYNAPVLPLVALWGIILGGEIRLINATYPVALVAFGCLVGYLHWSRRLHGWMASGILGVLIVISVYYQLFTLTGIYVGLLVLFTLGGVLWQRAIYQVPPWVAALALTNLFVVLALFHFRFVTGEHLDRVSTHPAVERLFVYDGADPVGRIVGKNIMVVQEGCTPDTYFISSHHGNAGVVLVDHKKHMASAAPFIQEGSNDIVVDCVKHQAIVGAFSRPSGLYVFDLQNWPALVRPLIPLPGRGVVYIIVDHVNDQYVVFPKDQVVFAVDVRTGKITGTLRGPNERAYDSKTNEITTLTEPDFSILRLKTVDSTSSPFRVLHRRSLGIPAYKRLQMYYHPGPREGTTLVTSLWDGTVTLYDRQLEPLRHIHVAPGISGMVLTRDQQYLLIGGYTDGNLYFMQMATWKVVASLYLGHRMRELRLSRDGRYVYVGTSQGAFRIDIARVLGQTPTALRP